MLYYRYLTKSNTITWQLTDVYCYRVTMRLPYFTKSTIVIIKNIAIHQGTSQLWVHKNMYTIQVKMWYAHFFPHIYKYWRGQIRLKWVEDENFPSPWNWLEICTHICRTFTWYRQMAWRSYGGKVPIARNLSLSDHRRKGKLSEK